VTGLLGTGIAAANAAPTTFSSSTQQDAVGFPRKSGHG
jgi:hypothetical protein